MRNRKSLRRIRHTRFFMIVLLVISIMLTSILVSNAVFHTNSVEGAENISKHFISVKVAANDTLWALAEEYMNTEHYSYKSFIAEVTDMNDLKGHKIYAGQRITIPIID